LELQQHYRDILGQTAARFVTAKIRWETYVRHQREIAGKPIRDEAPFTG